mmetsp:Transcript_3543/g.5461  ORF Transcript_3543/g.5461 Transcript_3543/m.5461 type:complete len:217 (-) Transcript_3543:517-1167(-)
MESVYWEAQESDELCAVHALNTALQGPYYDPISLASIAQEIDREEQNLYGTSFSSENVGATGFYSVQVISKALQNQSIEMSYYSLSNSDPTQEECFICNHQDHWLTLRKVQGSWFNLNSLNDPLGPKPISEFYLAAFLENLQMESYTIFVLKGNLPAFSSVLFPNLAPHQMVFSKETLSRTQEDDFEKAVQMSIKETQEEEDEDLKRAIELSLQQP